MVKLQPYKIRIFAPNPLLHTGLRKDGEVVLDAHLLKGYEVETWIGF